MKRWLSKIFSASPRRRRPRRRPVTLKLERLETRELLSGNPIIVLTLQEDNGAVVTVTGSDADGPVSYSGGIGPGGAGGSDFTITVAFGVSNSPGSPTDALLQQGTILIINNTGSTHTLHVNLSAQGFTEPNSPPPLTLFDSASGSLDDGSLSGDFQGFADATDSLFGKGFASTDLPFAVSGPSQSFRVDESADGFSPNGQPYSISSFANYTLAGGSQATLIGGNAQTAATTPAIHIVKLTNGTDNDTAPTAGTPDGPIIQVGGPVTWTYDVTNPGNEPIANVVVTDDNGTPGDPADDFHPAPVLSGGFNVGDTNQDGLLDPGETWQYTASSTAQLGQYSNVGTVTGTSTVTNTPLTANNPDHYFGVDAFIQITPSPVTNEVGHAETFTITVTALPDSTQLDPADVSFSTPAITYPGLTPDLEHPATATFDHRTGNVAFYTVTINSSVTGVFEVKASDDITFSSSMSPNTAQNPNPLTLTRTTGDGYVVPGSPSPGGDSPDALKAYVDARITITPSPVTNEVGHAHTFTVTVQQDLGDGNGFVNAPDGTVVHLTLTNSAGATGFFVGDGTAEDVTIANGTAVFQVNSPTTGQVSIDGLTTVAVDPDGAGPFPAVDITRETGDGLSGDSPDALKAFVDARITITPSPVTNEVGQAHTFTVTVQQDLGDGAGFVNAPDGTVVHLTLTNTLGATAAFVGDGTAEDVTIANGTAVFQVNSPTTGQVSIDGLTTVAVDPDGAGPFPAVDITRETGDNLSGDSPDALKAFVDARITITPSPVTNEVGQAHTFTVAVQQDLGDGAGFVNAPDGTVVHLTLTNAFGATAAFVGDGTAEDVTISNGTAVFQVNSPTTGQVSIDGLTTVAVDPDGAGPFPAVDITRETGDGLSGDSPDALKAFVDARITITPSPVTNEVGHAHTFTVAVQQDLGDGNGFVNAPDGTVVHLTLTNSSGATAAFVGDGTAEDVTIANGTAVFQVNSPTTGQVSIDGLTTVAVDPDGAGPFPAVDITRETGDNLSGDSPDALKTFVDAFITIAPNAINPVNAPHTFVVQVFADNGDGTGFHQVQDDEPVTETLTAGNGASITQISPGSGAGLASATYNLTTTTAFSPGVTFTSPTAGTVTGHAATVIVVGGVTLNRETDGMETVPGSGQSNSGDAVKTFTNPAINTVASAPVLIGSGVKLNDTAVLSGAFNPTGFITFTLSDSSNVAVYTDTVTLAGNTGFADVTVDTSMGDHPGGFLPLATGAYLWTASYSGDDNNSDAFDNGQNESVVVSPPAPAIQILKETNGANNDTAPGLQVPVGTPITWTYFVTAAGSGEPIKNVVVTDDNGTPGDTSDDFHPTPVLSGGFNVGDANQNGLLDPTETWQYTQSGPAGGAVAGQYTNNAVVTGNGNVSNIPVTAQNPDNYFGIPFIPHLSGKVTLLGSSGDITGQAYFVNGLYRDILGRAPDDDGVTAWVLYLQAGGSRQQVAAAFWESPEHHGLEVNQLYETLLNREAGPSERAAWVNAWAPGMSETDVALMLLTSPEYTAAHPTGASFVAGLYQSVLGRAPDAAGVATWQLALADGASRTAVARSFLTSAERYQDVIDQYFTNFLDRSPAPGEEQGWVTALESGLSLNSAAEAFLASGEYYVEAP